MGLLGVEEHEELTKPNLHTKSHKQTLSNRLLGRWDLRDTESPETVLEAAERGQPRAWAKSFQQKTGFAM